MVGEWTTLDTVSRRTTPTGGSNDRPRDETITERTGRKDETRFRRDCGSDRARSPMRADVCGTLSVAPGARDGPCLGRRGHGPRGAHHGELSLRADKSAIHSRKPHWGWG